MEVLPLALHRELKEELFLNAVAIGLDFKERSGCAIGRWPGL